VVIEIEREKELLNRGDAPISGSRVFDTGVGFNEANFDSFSTSTPPSLTTSASTGRGKGIGRMTWLKAFDRVEVDNVFGSTGETSRRQFIFSEDFNPQKALTLATSTISPPTRIRLLGFSAWK
jgi:hypothetical protein